MWKITMTLKDVCARFLNVNGALVPLLQKFKLYRHRRRATRQTPAKTDKRKREKMEKEKPMKIQVGKQEIFLCNAARTKSLWCRKEKICSSWRLLKRSCYGRSVLSFSLFCFWLGKSFGLPPVPWQKKYI